MQVTTFRDSYKDLFNCPISSERMKNPVINNNCGHTFEEAQIQGWMNKRITEGQVADCPLCREPIGNLKINHLIRDAIGVLDDPDNSLASRLEDLNDEEQENVREAVTNIMEKRKNDLALNVPIKLEEPKNFMKKLVDGISGVYC